MLIDVPTRPSWLTGNPAKMLAAKVASCCAWYEREKDRALISQMMPAVNSSSDICNRITIIGRKHTSNRCDCLRRRMVWRRLRNPMSGCQRIECDKIAQAHVYKVELCRMRLILGLRFCPITWRTDVVIFQRQKKWSVLQYIISRGIRYSIRMTSKPPSQPMFRNWYIQDVYYRAPQDLMQMYQCIFNSLSKSDKAIVALQKAEYNRRRRRCYRFRHLSPQ